MTRADRRLPDECREVWVQLGICLTAQGSSRLRFGETEVIVNIAGPKECRIREIQTGKAQIRVKTFPEMHELNDIITTAVSNSMDAAAYPDSTVDIGITIVSDQGSLTCCAINAVVLALNDAGLKLVQEVEASCFVIRNGALFLDPSKREEETADGVATFVWEKKTGKVFSCFFEGQIDPELMVAAVNRAAAVPLVFQ